MIWDVERMWGSVCEACREVLAQVQVEVAGVSVTGFGADGLPLDRQGQPLYPMISWHCSRTLPQRDWLNTQISPLEIYSITGYHNYPINTINRLRWLREHAPQTLDRAYRWLMVQDYMVYRLTGTFSTEATIASTTMAFDLRTRTWSERLLGIVGVSPAIFPPIAEPGSVLGQVSKLAAEQTGLPAGTPVATGGHDCEIGALGSGVNSPETFIDITGTWEMVIAALDQFLPLPELFAEGIDYECHTIPGLYLCQGLMLAGGVVEWVLNAFYRDVPAERRYEALMEEAASFPPGARGVVVLPAFIRGMGAFQAHNAVGLIAGLTTTTERGQVARAVLEACCYQLRKQMEVISRYTGARPNSLLVLGGATRNPLWLQMKADVAGLPVLVPEHPEVTLLGAAMLAGVGAGLYASLDEAIEATRFGTRAYTPDPGLHERYADLFEGVFMPLAPSLAEISPRLAALSTA
jgi:L-fuculokinase